MALEARFACVLLSIEQDHLGDAKGAAQMRLREPDYYKIGKSHLNNSGRGTSESGQIADLVRQGNG